MIRFVNVQAAREVAMEMQRGEVSTRAGTRRIDSVGKQTLVEAWRQAGEIIEALVEANDQDLRA